jgi:hypothetical protein
MNHTKMYQEKMNKKTVSQNSMNKINNDINLCIYIYTYIVFCLEGCM